MGSHATIARFVEIHKSLRMMADTAHKKIVAYVPSYAVMNCKNMFHFVIFADCGAWAATRGDHEN